VKPINFDVEQNLNIHLSWTVAVFDADEIDRAQLVRAPGRPASNDKAGDATRAIELPHKLTRFVRTQVDTYMHIYMFALYVRWNPSPN
jgi:hypothetical protein